MFRQAIAFAAATCTAVLLGQTTALAYGHDAKHEPHHLAQSTWQLTPNIVDRDLEKTVLVFGPLEQLDRPLPVRGGHSLLVLAASSSKFPVPSKTENEEQDSTGDVESDENKEQTSDDIAVALASPTDDADEKIGKVRKDRNRLWDPIEGVNRKVLGANDWLDRRVFRPVARAYGFITPDFLEQGIRNIFRNLREPATVGNRVLQGEFKMAGKTGARFLLNTTIGVAGFVDFADQIGLEREVADFGQTLYTYGVSAGPYLVLPLMGPTTTRDGFGQLVDRAADPATWVSLGAGPTVAVSGLDGVSLREEVGDTVDQLRSTSIDWYSTLRSAYYQDRRAFLEGEDAVNNESVDDLFDEFDDFDAEESQSQLN